MQRYRNNKCKQKIIIYICNRGAVCSKEDMVRCNQCNAYQQQRLRGGQRYRWIANLKHPLYWPHTRKKCKKLIWTKLVTGQVSLDCQSEASFTLKHWPQKYKQKTKDIQSSCQISLDRLLHTQHWPKDYKNTNKQKHKKHKKVVGYLGRSPIYASFKINCFCNQWPQKSTSPNGGNNQN